MQYIALSDISQAYFAQILIIAFLHNTAEHPIKHQPKIGERFEEMDAHDFMEFIQPLRVFIVENTTDKKTIETLLKQIDHFAKQFDHFAKQFGELNHLELIRYTVTRKLPAVPEPEFLSMPLLQDAADLYYERFGELTNTQQENLPSSSPRSHMHLTYSPQQNILLHSCFTKKAPSPHTIRNEKKSQMTLRPAWIA